MKQKISKTKYTKIEKDCITAIEKNGITFLDEVFTFVKIPGLSVRGICFDLFSNGSATFCAELGIGLYLSAAGGAALGLQRRGGAHLVV